MSPFDAAGRPVDFLPEAWGILAGIEEALQGISSPRAAEAERLLLVLTHRMAGSAAQFGLDGVSRVADAMESAARRLAEAEVRDRDEGLRRLHESAARLGRLLTEGEAAVPPGDPVWSGLRDLARREPEVLEYFLPEMREHLEEAGEILVRGAAAGASPGLSADDVAVLFRRFHTLKGAAFVVGCRPVGELAHRVEDALVVARAHPARFDAAGVRASLAAVDLLHQMADALAGQPPGQDLEQARSAVLGLLGEWAAAVPAGVPEPVAAGEDRDKSAEKNPAATPAPGLRLQLRSVDGLVRLTGELLAVRNRLQREIQRVEALREAGQASVERLRRSVRDFSSRHFDPLLPIEPPVETAGSVDESAPGAGLSALELDRYDDFNVLSRRLEEIAADLTEVESEEAELVRDLTGSGEDLRRLVDELHTGVGRLRLVPMSQVFGRGARLARRVAAAAGKEVALEVSGERVELDAAIAEAIWEPLLHLVQNAVGHGLESAEGRLAAGKPAAGRLAFRAAAEGRRIAVEIEDDGAGIAAAQVLRRAGELGLRPADELARLDEREALDLVFLPGFSALSTATETSGRGVGLDVVRTTLERLGGSAEVRSAPGSGTCFRLVFPVSLVVSEALLVRIGEERIALPATAVERIVEADLTAGAPAPEIGGGPAPLLDLGPVFGHAPQPAGVRRPAAVVGAPGRWRALLVDEVLGSETAVLRPLGPFFARFDLFSGAILTREGRLVLLLNVQAALAAGSRPAVPATAPPAPRRRPVRVLLADDSVSVRKVLGGTLARAGYEVALAADGEEAMALLEAGPYDLLLTDLEMPRRNGYELLAWVRRRPATARLPAVVVTTRIGEKHQELARQVGASLCLSKPVEEELLLRTVARLARPGRGEE